MSPRVGYVLKRFPRLSETFLAAELLELRRQGADVAVFAISRPEEPYTHGFLDELDVPVTYLPHRPLREPWRVLRGLAGAFRRSPIGWLRAAGWALVPPRIAALRKLAQASVLRVELEAAAVEHVHAHFATAAARLANLVSRMGGPRYSVTTHAKDIWHEGVDNGDLCDKLGRAEFVVTVTPTNRDHLTTILHGRPSVHLVPNSVDVGRLTPTGRDPEPDLVLCVARLVEKKGVADLVEACARLTTEGTQMRLVVVGDGPQREALQAAARDAGVGATFTGALPQERVLAHYRRAAVFALPCTVARDGDRDGLPTAVLEAMALGVPVVATALNGLADVVLHGRTGLVVPEHDPDALAAAVRKLLHDKALATDLAHGARAHVEQRYTMSSAVERLRQLIEAGA